MSAGRAEQPAVMAKLAAVSHGRNQSGPLSAAGPSVPKQHRKTDEQIENDITHAQWDSTHLRARTTTGNLLHVASTTTQLKRPLSPPSEFDKPLDKLKLMQHTFKTNQPR